MEINDLSEEAQEELKEILRDDILRSYHNGELKEEVINEDGSTTFAIVKKGLSDEEIIRLYNNEGFWDRQIIEEYLIRWKNENK